MKKIKFKVMGSPRIWIGENEITKDFSKKTLAILIYLIFSDGQRASREQLMNFLWSESDEKAARYNLRHNLWNIRRVFRLNGYDDEWLDTNNQDIHIADMALWEVDVLKLYEFEKEGLKNQWELADEKIRILLRLYKANFLENFYLSDCEEFNDWLYFKREEFQRLFITILIELAKGCEEKHKTVMACDIYKALISYMPYDEKIHFCLIRNLLDSGDQFNALRYFERHKKQLREELNVSISKELQQLISEVKEREKSEGSNKSQVNEVILTNEYPLKTVNYMGISICLDRILEYFSEAELTAFDTYLWSDLARICVKIRKKVRLDDIPMECLTESSEKNRIFKAFYHLLSYLHDNCGFTLDLRRNSEMDKISFEFFESFILTDQGKIMKNW